MMLTGAYRLFFPAAALFAGLAVPMWLLILGGVQLALPQDPLGWHMHEMLFGYLGAALAGFLLTAIPNWTKRPPLVGLRLLMLFGLWLVARIALLCLTDAAIVTIGALLFPVCVASVATREIWLGGNRRNLPVAGLVWLFAVADGVYLLSDPMLGIRMGFGLALIMIALIGGRVTPAFSRNWLKAQGRSEEIAAFGLIDKLALITTILCVIFWVLFEATPVVGLLAVVAAVAHVLRLIGWRGHLVRGEALLVALHLAYAWVPIALICLGLSALTDVVSQAQVFHAVGAGAIASMTLIVMMRALLGHNNLPLVANRMDQIMIFALHLAAITRIAAPIFPGSDAFLHFAGLFWVFGYLLFLLRYLPIALQPRHESSH